VVERRVVSILAELLGIEKVGVNDNFFFLGGHSLLGTQLIARARDSFRVELPLRTVFDRPTAAELSAEIERMLGTQGIRAD
jgi:acyl carrier protein